MKHNNNNNVKFFKTPSEFNKNTPRDILQYCLGATMYTPGTKDIYKNIIDKRWNDLKSLVMCFEDSIPESDLEKAELNVRNILNKLNEAIKDEIFNVDDLPLLIFRVRNLKQFISFTKNLTPNQLKLITAFNFPKFTSVEAGDYFEHLKKLNEKSDEIIYGMPILESKELAYIETRHNEMVSLNKTLKEYKQLVLNIRVGGTDFSSYFGVRRSINNTIYDIGVVKDILFDIINVFGRDNEFVISAPVWEYFSVHDSMKFEENLPHKIDKSIFNKTRLIDEAIDGLIKEILLDKVNGFIGKTIIHPTHIKYVNALYSVTKEEYEDAKQINNHHGGVIKSTSKNKMNEINPHMSWAKNILSRAKIYGVIETEKDYFNLFFS